MKKSQHLIYGIHAVTAMIEKMPWRIKKIILQKSRQDIRIKKLLDKASEENITVEYQSVKSMDDQVEKQVHQGVIAECADAQCLSESDLKHYLEQLQHPPFILILDGVQDPHNLGACLRSCDAAGVDLVIAPKDRAVGLTATVHKVAAGAAVTIPFMQVTNLARTLRTLKDLGVWLYGASHEAEQTIYKIDFSGAIGVVLGAEGKGLRRLTEEHCDGLFSIPMKGFVSSLNVSVATGITLFEVVRQRSL